MPARITSVQNYFDTLNDRFVAGASKVTEKSPSMSSPVAASLRPM